MQKVIHPNAVDWAAKLRSLYYAEPFAPFVVHMADGRKFPVGRPEWMGIAPNGRRIIVHLRDDSMHIINLQSVARLQVKSNGKRRK